MVKEFISSSKRATLEGINSQRRTELQRRTPGGVSAEMFYMYKQKGLPDLKEGCWYIGPVAEYFAGNPVVLHGASKVLLKKNGCCAEKGQLLVYCVDELRDKGKFTAYGEAKEIYS